MNINDKVRREKTGSADFPRFEGHVKLILHNPTTGKTKIHEKHNDPTNALRDIFAGNYGGLVDYDNFTDLFKTWLGGILVFASPLDTTSEGWADDYGIPARTSNACVAHAGQTPIGEAPYDQADDTTRGNPDNAGMVKTVGSTKLCWEWGTSAGNAPLISSLGLTHTDVGSYGCGVASNAQALLNPFASVGCKSKTYTYGDNANAVLAVNGNMAYNFYLYNDSGTSKVHIYKTPMNVTKYKLQGGSLLPLTDYTTQVDATLPNSYGTGTISGMCYYHFDFANNKLILFGVPTEGGDDLYKDTIDLDSGNVVHDDLEVTDARLWQFYIPNNYDSSGWRLTTPTKAMIYNNHLFVYGYGTGARDNWHPNKMYSFDLSNSAVSEVDTTSFSSFALQNSDKISERWSMLGGIIIHNSFLINGDKTFGTLDSGLSGYNPIPSNVYGLHDKVSSPCFGIGKSLNSVAVNKLYLATKWNLDEAVSKTSAMSMRVEYTLTEV